MAISKEIMHTCPYCHKSHPLDIYLSVNTKTDSDLRDRCVSGEIFQVSCPHCHKEYMLEHDLFYIDDVHRFALWLSKKPLGEKAKPYRDVLVKANYLMRRCETISEFVEKIQILEDGVDDVLVELAKYDAFIDYMNNKKGKVQDVSSVRYQRVDNGVIKVNVMADDKGMSFLIPMGILEEERDEHPDLFAIAKDDFALVNAAWMTSLFLPKAGEA